MGDPQIAREAQGLRAPPAKVRFLNKWDPQTVPLTEACLFLNQLASAVVHHKDDADFMLASSNPGNTIIVICRGILVACAQFMDWFGWQEVAVPCALDVSTSQGLQHLQLHLYICRLRVC